MNNVFDFSRFSKVLVNDLRKTYQNYGITAIILLLMPVIYCFLYGMLPLIFGEGWQTAEQYSRLTVLVLSIVALILSFPTQVYGKITDKKEGTNFISLPASTFEKFLSMVLVAAVIAPVVFLVGFFGVDAILSAVGLFRGGSLFSLIHNSELMNNEYVTINLWQGGFLSLALNMLIFLLGAIYFKKFKVGKTILALFVLGVAFSSIFVPILSHVVGSQEVFSFTNGDVQSWIEAHIENAELYINLIINAVRLVEFGVVAGLIYWRVKTLKH